MKQFEKFISQKRGQRFLRNFQGLSELAIPVCITSKIEEFCNTLGVWAGGNFRQSLGRTPLAGELCNIGGLRLMRALAGRHAYKTCPTGGPYPCKLSPHSPRKNKLLRFFRYLRGSPTHILLLNGDRCTFSESAARA